MIFRLYVWRHNEVNIFVIQRYGDNRDLHVRTHAFPTRRSAELVDRGDQPVGDQLYGQFANAPFDREVDRRRRAVAPAMAHVEPQRPADMARSDEHTSELQSLMRNSYAVFFFKKKKNSSIILTSFLKHNNHYTKHYTRQLY